MAENAPKPPPGFVIESNQSGPTPPPGFVIEKQEMGEFDLPFELSGRQAKTALGLMTTFDPKKELEIIKSNYPDIKFSQDDEGNIIADATAYGGNVGYVNAPGISARDLTDLGFQVAAFTPAGKVANVAAQAGKGLLTRMGLTGAATAGTQAGVDLAGQATGATEDVSLSNIDKGDVGVAGAAGAAFETLSGPIGRVASRIAQTFRKGRPVVTDAIRNEFKAAAREAGRDPSEVTDDLIMSWVKAADDATSGKVAGTPAAVQQMDEFGIPYTRGQATGNLRQLEVEDTLRNVRGTRAADTMADFGQRQEGAIQGAATNIQRQMGKTDDVITTPNQAASAVKEGLQGRAAVAEEAIGEAYEQVGDAFLSVDGLKGLTRRLVQVPSREKFVMAERLAPATNEAMKKIRQLNRILGKAEGKIKPVHISKLEEQRKLLGDLIGSAKNNTDRRQITILKRQFDEAIDDAVNGALFSGDDGAIEALKNARAINRDFKLKFAPQNARTKAGRTVQDTAGKYIDEIISTDPNVEQISNWLYGASKIGAKKGSAEFARRLKTTLGPDSPEFNAVRQGALLKLMEPAKNQTAISGKQFASRLKEATEGTGQTFMKELFSPKEIAKLRRFAEAVKRAQPDPSNPSRTAYKAASMVKQQMDDFLRLMGWSAGGIQGRMGAEAVIQSKGFLGNLRNAARAQTAIDANILSRAPVPAVAAPGSVGTNQKLQDRQ